MSEKENKVVSTPPVRGTDPFWARQADVSVRNGSCPQGELMGETDGACG